MIVATVLEHRTSDLEYIASRITHNISTISGDEDVVSKTVIIVAAAVFLSRSLTFYSYEVGLVTK